MAVMQPRENVYISTQIENITESVFVCVFECACVCVCVRVDGLFAPLHSYPQFPCLFDYELVQVMGFYSVKNNIGFASRYRATALNQSIYLSI